MGVLVYILLISTSIHSLNALKCYICAATEYDLDRRCFDHPEELEGALRNCNKNYCTSVRQESLNDKAKTIFRSCMDDLGLPNGIVEDLENRFYIKSCKKDGCNGGTGKEISGNMLV